MAIGHVSLDVSKVAKAAGFYRTLGLRPIMERPFMAIFELRGGTHLLLWRTKKKPGTGFVRAFDFMVDDVISFRDELASAGIKGTKLGRDPYSGHRFFDVRDPDGHRLRVYSSHASSPDV